MSNTLPEIRIKDAWLLREKVSSHLHKLWAKEGVPLHNSAQMESVVTSYKGAWQPFEHKVLSAMTELLGVSFRQNIIDVYIAPWFGAMSDPMILGAKFKPDEFIDTLTHELIHRLLTDNTALAEDTDILEIWRKLFGSEHSFVTLVHIPVHAVLKAIYYDVLTEPMRHERDISDCKKWNATEYVKSWEYVDSHNYKQIISRLKESYAEK